MIHIGKDWYVGGDPLNITLYQMKTKKKTGETYYHDVAYFPTIEALLHGLVRREIRLAVSTSDKIEDVALAIEEIHRMIEQFCKRLEIEIAEFAKAIKKGEK